MVLVLAGCSSSAGTSDGDKASPVSQAEDSTVQEYVEGKRFLGMAEHELARRCMEAKGFQLRLPEMPSGDTDPDDVASESLPNDMNLTVELGTGGDLESSREKGYGLFEEFQEEFRLGWSPGQPSRVHVLPPDPNAAYLQTLSPVEQGRWREALDGTTDASVTLEDGEPVYYMKDGCVTEARNELWSDVARWLSLTTEREKVSGEILDRAEGSDGYQRALRSWRACVKERGHTAKDPLTLRDKLYDDYERAELLTDVRDREIEAAVADGECQEKVELEAAYVQALDTARDKLDPQAARVLLEEEELREAAVARAKRILSES